MNDATALRDGGAQAGRRGVARAMLPPRPLEAARAAGQADQADPDCASRCFHARCQMPPTGFRRQQGHRRLTTGQRADQESIMPSSPAVIGNLAEAAMGRPARVLTVGEPAPGFIELGLRADPPPGGWQPGHEVQFRVTPTKGRRYTVRAVSPEHISILAATDANGPGTAWISRLRPGDAVTVLAGRHRPLRGTGPRRLYLGDSCTLGTLDAYARDDNSMAVIEARPEAVAPLTARWPRYLFLPATPVPGEAAQTWLTHAGNDALRDLDGAVLLGHAQSIQRQRRALTDSGELPRPAITAKAYWADGKQGL